MDVFKIGYYSSFYSCLSAIKIIYPIVQAIFVVVQVRWLCSLSGKVRETEPPVEGALISCMDIVQLPLQQMQVA